MLHMIIVNVAVGLFIMLGIFLEGKSDLKHSNAVDAQHAMLLTLNKSLLFLNL